MNALADAHDASVQTIDTSTVCVHQHGACFSRNRRQSTGQSRGGVDQQDSCGCRCQLAPGEFGEYLGARENRMQYRSTNLNSCRTRGCASHGPVVVDAIIFGTPTRMAGVSAPFTGPGRHRPPQGGRGFHSFSSSCHAFSALVGLGSWHSEPAACPSSQYRLPVGAKTDPEVKGEVSPTNVGV